MKLVVTLVGVDTPAKRINIHLAEETEDALKGLAVLTEPVDVWFDEPLIVLGARVEGVNA